MTEILVAATTREVRFIKIRHTTRLDGPIVEASEVRPAGTEVYVTPVELGLFKIRIPGTLFEQTVNADTIEVL